MEINFEEILVDSLNNIGSCLDSVVGYHTQINIDKVIEAKSIVKQILQLVYLKNSKLNRDEDENDSHSINPNIK